MSKNNVNGFIKGYTHTSGDEAPCSCFTTFFSSRTSVILRVFVQIFYGNGAILCSRNMFFLSTQERLYNRKATAFNSLSVLVVTVEDKDALPVAEASVGERVCHVLTHARSLRCTTNMVSTLPPLEPLLRTSAKRTRAIFESCPDDSLGDEDKR